MKLACLSPFCQKPKANSQKRLYTFLRLTPYALRGFPQPFTSFASIPGHASERFALYDISGRKKGVYSGGRIGWDVSPGVYFLRPDALHPHPDTRILRIVKVR